MSLGDFIKKQKFCAVSMTAVGAKIKMVATARTGSSSDVSPVMVTCDVDDVETKLLELLRELEGGKYAAAALPENGAAALPDGSAGDAAGQDEEMDEMDEKMDELDGDEPEDTAEVPDSADATDDDDEWE